MAHMFSCILGVSRSRHSTCEFQGHVELAPREKCEVFLEHHYFSARQLNMRKGSNRSHRQTIWTTSCCRQICDGESLRLQ